MKKKEGPGQVPYIAKAKPQPKSGERQVIRADWDEGAQQERARTGGVLSLSEKEKELIDEVKILLMEDTLEADREILAAIDAAGFSAVERWQELHIEEDPEKKHRFSETAPKHINPFARSIHEWLQLNDKLSQKSIILELGSGYGNDALFLARNSKARVTGVDKADVGIKAAQEEYRSPNREEYLEWIETALESIASRHGQSLGKTKAQLHSLVLRGKCTTGVIRKSSEIGVKKYREEIATCIGRMNDARADFDTDDYRETLKAYERAGINMVYSHSTLHYIPPHILREEISPMIANALRDKKGNPTGRFCVAIKLSSSASAQSPNKIRLAPDHPYDPSYDTVDKLVRFYAKGEEEVKALFPDFDVEFCEVVDNVDYDKEGDTEIMCQLILRPKVGKAA